MNSTTRPSVRIRGAAQSEVRPFTGSRDELARRLLDAVTRDSGLVEALIYTLATPKAGSAPGHHKRGACADAAARPVLLPDPHADDDALIPLETVKQLTGLGKTKIYALVRAGEFPAPYKPGGAATRWSRRDVRIWRESLKPAR